jgi:hypothetical protein
MTVNDNIGTVLPSFFWSWSNLAGLGLDDTHITEKHNMHISIHSNGMSHYTGCIKKN